LLPTLKLLNYTNYIITVSSPFQASPAAAAALAATRGLHQQQQATSLLHMAMAASSSALMYSPAVSSPCSLSKGELLLELPALWRENLQIAPQFKFYKMMKAFIHFNLVLKYIFSNLYAASFHGTYGNVRPFQRLLPLGH
jgi:hypothetical protein